MAKTDPRIDAYIAKCAPFAQPILVELRRRVHAACPEVVETIKWSMPFFEYHGVLCNMAGFKQHCAFGFWKGALVTGEVDREAMGSLGRLTSLKDLPSQKTLADWLKKAMAINTADESLPRAIKQPKAPLVVAPALI